MSTRDAFYTLAELRAAMLAAHEKYAAKDARIAELEGLLGEALALLGGFTRIRLAKRITAALGRKP